MLEKAHRTIAIRTIELCNALRSVQKHSIKSFMGKTRQKQNEKIIKIHTSAIYLQKRIQQHIG